MMVGFPGRPALEDRALFAILGARTMRTLLLTRSETEVLLEPDTLLADLRAAFRGYSLDRGVRAQRVRSALPGPGTATVLFPGTAADIPAYTVKVHAKFPEQQPAIRGVLCLCDGQTGELLAVMDSRLISPRPDGTLQHAGHGRACSARRAIGGCDRRRPARRSPIAFASHDEADWCRPRLRHGAGSCVGVRRAHAPVARSHDRSE